MVRPTVLRSVDFCLSLLKIKAMRKFIFLLFSVVILSCSQKGGGGEPSQLDGLRDTLSAIASRYSGEVGIALVTGEGDTLTVNNEAKYPLMSVFKLHQAMALCDMMERHGIGLDTMVEIRCGQMNPDTWSPMRDEHGLGPIMLPVSELLRYTLMQSDNNASNYMFDNLLSVEATDRYAATLIPRESFRLTVTEEDMFEDHSLCYENRSSPLGAALLIERLCTDTEICTRDRDFIIRSMRECRTGTDRIVAPLAGKEGVTVAHKTGSGFRDPSTGILTAHNDVAFISLPDGRHYSLAVLVKDFNGSEAEAAKAIAEVSATVYAAMAGE